MTQDNLISQRHSSDHRTWIKFKIASILSLYFRPDDDPDLIGAIGENWADALEDMSRDEISAACVKWIKNETKRPTPADIRKNTFAHDGFSDALGVIPFIR